MLKEFEMSNGGPIFFEVESTSGVDVSVIPADGDEAVAGFSLDEDLPDAKVHIEIEDGSYVLDVSADGSWTIFVEQKPVFGAESVEEPEYPLKINGERWSVFGPFLFDGFRSLEVSSNTLLGIQIINGQGEVIEVRSYDGRSSNDGSSVELDPLNIDSVCWVECTISGPEWRRPEDVEYRLTFNKPE